MMGTDIANDQNWYVATYKPKIRNNTFSV